MLRAKSVIEQVAKQTERVVLFHSASGKDSIALLDLLAPHFKEVVCVYMYIVKDLAHIKRYISYAENKYPNCKFCQVPHFALLSYIKSGYLGCKQNKKQRQYSMAELNKMVCERYGIEWTVMGFKQSDSMNRRLMLRTYKDDAINENQKKAYPLSCYKNADVLNYIVKQNLIRPETYGKGQSAGTAINDLNYLLFLKENFPSDLKRIFREFPLCERLIYEHEYQNNE